IAGGFTAAQAHRNLPVCGDCALSLAEAFAFAERHLISTMAGQSYMILPYSNVDEINEELRHSLKEKPDKYYLIPTTTKII
ncbi:MAG TPA: TM1802 family CRISPR-associated protein, partial [Saprospiraceae bacterium]|nr:TM1802 family CRISPR-associated protein [Saprospiraceae bacterium]